MIGIVTKVGAGLLTAGAATAVVVAVGSSRSEPEQAIVVGHVDGDTFDADVSGSRERIRLINIDTPETKDPNKPVQCLGPEAAAFLAARLPIGSSVRLEFDVEREDNYGRTLAAVFSPDGAMVNADIARAGLAKVESYGDNTRFLPPIEQAGQEGASARTGLHAADVTCTYPAQATVVTELVVNAPTVVTHPNTLSSRELYDAAARTGLARQGAAAFLRALDRAQADLTWLALKPEEQALVRDQARSAHDKAAAAESALRQSAVGAQQREERIVAQAEAQRVAKQQEAARVAEQQRAAEQERRAAAEARRQAAQAQAQEQSEAQAAPARSAPAQRHTGNSGHPCLPGERDGDHDGYCGEGR